MPAKGLMLKPTMENLARKRSSKTTRRKIIALCIQARRTRIVVLPMLSKFRQKRNENQTNMVLFNERPKIIAKVLSEVVPCWKTILKRLSADMLNQPASIRLKQRLTANLSRRRLFLAINECLNNRKQKRTISVIYGSLKVQMTWKLTWEATKGLQKVNYSLLMMNHNCRL